MTGTLSLAAPALLLLLPSGLRPAHLSVHLSETLPPAPQHTVPWRQGALGTQTPPWSTPTMHHPDPPGPQSFSS